MAAIADERGYWVCNTVWMLDDFTLDNGAIRVVPGSHRWGQLPHQVLSDPAAPHPQELLLTARAATVVVMNAHLWHGGTANRTSKPRRALHAFYARRDKPQQQYQKQLLRPEVQQNLSPQLRHLLALDDPLNDEISVNVAVRSGFMKGCAASGMGGPGLAYSASINRSRSMLQVSWEERAPLSYSEMM